RVAHRPFRDFGLGVFAAEAKTAPVGQRQEVRIRPLDHAQAVPGQVQVGDDPGIEQADRVAGGGVAEARVELLGDRGTADDAPAFQHPRLQPGRGEVRRAYQAVVTTADDQDVA